MFLATTTTFTQNTNLLHICHIFTTIKFVKRIELHRNSSKIVEMKRGMLNIRSFAGKIRILTLDNSQISIICTV